jgi:prefoldin subunit 5
MEHNPWTKISETLESLQAQVSALKAENERLKESIEVMKKHLLAQGHELLIDDWNNGSL